MDSGGTSYYFTNYQQCMTTPSGLGGYCFHSPYYRAVAEEVIAKLEREGWAHVTIAKKRWLLDFAYRSEDMSTHGSRSMAATRLNEMGRWKPDAIERQLAHQEASAVRRAYTHGAEFWSERVRMMQAWSDYLDGLREAGAAGPFARAALP
jgi:integrase